MTPVLSAIVWSYTYIAATRNTANQGSKIFCLCVTLDSLLINTTWHFSSQHWWLWPGDNSILTNMYWQFSGVLTVALKMWVQRFFTLPNTGFDSQSGWTLNYQHSWCSSLTFALFWSRRETRAGSFPQERIIMGSQCRFGQWRTSPLWSSLITHSRR